MVAQSIASAIRASASALALSTLVALAAGCSDGDPASSEAGLAASSDTGVAVTFQLLEGTVNVAFEGGRPLHIGVRLSHAPTSDVVVRLTSSIPGEATVSPATLRIKPSQWDTPTSVEVTAVDDALQDGIVPFALEGSVLASDDSRFANSLATRYRLYTVDNDRAAVAVTPVTEARTTESGGAAGFDLRLSVAPSDDVRLTLTTSNAKEGILFPAFVVFTKDNWSVGQRVLVRGVDDGVVDGPQSYSLDFAVASGDLEYASSKPASIALVNEDDEVQAPVVEASPGGVIVSGQGDSANEFYVRLKARPTRPILVSTAVDGGAPVRLEPQVVGFSPDNWDVPQKVRAVAKSAAGIATDTAFTVQLSLVSEAGAGAEVAGMMRGASVR